MKKKIDNVVFLSENVNIRAGGPSGYIANLEHAINESKIPNKIVFINATMLGRQIKRINFVGRMLCFYVPVSRVRHNMRRNIIKYLTNRLFAKELDKYDFRTITVHSVYDVLFAKKYIKSRKLSAKILQMSHSPQPPSEESHDRDLAEGIPDADARYAVAQKVERDAFTAADMYIFPSAEAVECYSGALTYFDELLKTHPIKYVRTGCRPLQTDKTRDEMRKKYNVKTPYVVTYIGRHNEIKGYDFLQKMAKQILDKRDDITFLVGGRVGKIPPLEHPRWIELGQINPAEVLVATDVFILPNRQTYFDLILLEVLSTGIHVVASNTGGNKTVYADTGVITLYNDEKDCIKKTLMLLDSRATRHLIKSGDIKKAWAEHYSPNQFAKNYINMIAEVCNGK